MWLYLGGLEQSHIAKLTPIVKKSCSQEWPMEVLTMLRSGTTLTPCKEGNLRDSSISYLVAFHARILALLEMEKAWQESEADCFTRSLGCAAKLSQDLFSWKTFLPLLQEEAPKWLGKLPRWGMIVAGSLYPLRPLEHCIDATGGSYWLTPSTMENLPVRAGEALENALHRGKDRKSRRKVLGRLNEQVTYLHTAVLLATPTASQANKPIRSPSPSREKGEHGEDLQDSIGRVNPESIGKKLCPKWVSILMGYPTTWLNCEHLETL